MAAARTRPVPPVSPGFPRRIWTACGEDTDSDSRDLRFSLNGLVPISLLEVAGRRRGSTMAREIGTPGESAVAHGLLLLAVVGFCTAFMVLLLAWAIGTSSTDGLWAVAVDVLLVVAVVRWRRKDYSAMLEAAREGSQFLKGGEGEIKLARALKALPDTYIVFHDFHPVSESGDRARWNVDHIVVGPTGVFVLDAKNWSRPWVPSAARSQHTRKAVNQAQANARDLKARLARWSGGELGNLFVVPIVVFTQDNAHTDRLTEGFVRTIPLGLLVREILKHTEAAIDSNRAARIALALFSQIPPDLQATFRQEVVAYAANMRAVVPAEAVVADSPVTDSVAGCPLCGGSLVRRTAKHGERAGKAFLGCENYSKTRCRFVLNLEE